MDEGETEKMQRGMNDNVDLFVRCSDRLPDKDGEYRVKHNCGCNNGDGKLWFTVEHGWDTPAMTRSFYRVIAWAPNGKDDRKEEAQ